MQTDGIISYNVCGVLFCPSFLCSKSTVGEGTTVEAGLKGL